ncbi:MAG: hypothetical protein AAGA50_14160 [Pseudomonadota bacterium]
MMRFFLATLVMLSATTAQDPAVAADAGLLTLPSSGLAIDLETGTISKEGKSGLCLERVSKLAGNTLVVARKPGDGKPNISVNGKTQSLSADGAGNTRLGTLRLSPEGQLYYLRYWKTGDKRSELLADGKVYLTWPNSARVRLLKVGVRELVVLVKDADGAVKLQKHVRSANGDVSISPETLLSFEGCRVQRVRLSTKVVWAQMHCKSDAGLFSFEKSIEEEGALKLASHNIDFVPLRGNKRTPGNIFVGVVSGSPAGLHFYYAVTGLLLNQSGEPRACASDAEGLQSWNQSYRLQALSEMFEKTDASVFADLARKSMELTLASQDPSPADISKSCGWSSTIYSKTANTPLKLLINQAVIANALLDGCRKLADRCPVSLRDKIRETRLCLVKRFEPDFDKNSGLYRISKDIDFRYEGRIAPWNWQISTAKLLEESSFQDRGRSIVRRFLKEWTIDENGALWRYWPKAYYQELSEDGTPVKPRRFEDTGHAGISLMSLKNFLKDLTLEKTEAINRRAEFLLSLQAKPPRDIDGQGLEGDRWFLKGGWADFGAIALHRAYARSVPARHSADAICAYAKLFDPSAPFNLTLDVLSCGDTCKLEQSYSYADWQAFLTDNPLFLLSGTKPYPSSARLLETCRSTECSYR